MFLDNFIRLSQVSVAYLLLIFGPAYIMLSPLTSRRSLTDKILLYFVAGNFYVMNIIFLLLFLQCTSRIITIIVIIGGAVVLRYFFDRKRFVTEVFGHIKTMALLSEGIYGWNFYRREIISKIRLFIKKSCGHIFRHHLFELLGFLGCLGIHSYYIGYRYVRYSTFGTSDEPVHLLWIQSMLQGKIFIAGIYPFGFHNIIYAIIKVFGFRAFTGVRYFGFIMIMFMFIMLFLLMKKVFRSSYAPIVGIFLYAAADIFYYVAWDRLQYCLPQEFGILFLYPMLIFLYNYICNKKRMDLFFFGICFALTLYVHYYITIIALLICFCVGLSGLLRIIKGKMLFRILICGILSTVIGILPMGIGLMTGHGLQDSLYWAMGVIEGKSNTENAGAEKLPQPEKVLEVKETVNVKTIIRKIIAKAYVIKDYTVSILIGNTIFVILVISMFLILIKTFIHIIIKSKRNETFLQFSIMLYTAILMVLLCCYQLGLPVIIENYRVSEFLAYIIPVLLCMPLGLFHELMEIPDKTKIANFSIIAIMAGLLVVVYGGGHERKLGEFWIVQSEAAVKMFYKILDQYEDKKWTIVSTVDEYSVVLDCGFHVELIDFLNELQNYNEDPPYYFPNPDEIFFFIEKRPYVPNKQVNFNGKVHLKEEPVTFPEITEEDAKKMIYNEANASNYYKSQRDVIMAKAYYWAKQYMYYFPNEMTVFYEDDNFICFHLKQEPYYLNNLKIDYKYNKLR